MNIIKVIQAKEVFAPYFREKLSPSLSYKIYKFCKLVEQEEMFYNQKMKEIIEEFAQRNDNGGIESNDGRIRIDSKRTNEANQAVKDLQSINVEVPNVKFTLDELSEIKLSVTDIVALDEFIVENNN